jgi:hypothetical protein
MTPDHLTAHDLPVQPALAVSPRGFAAPGRGVQVAAATLFSAAAIFGPVALTFRGIRKGSRR